MSGRVRAVRRRRAVVGVLIAAAATAGIVALAEGLRHPHPPQPPPTQHVEDVDPRAEVACPERGRADTRVRSADLLACPQSWDGQRVRYRGEVVAGVLERRGGAWVQLNDDAYAGELGPLPTHRAYRGANAGVGVFVGPGLAAVVEHHGEPGVRGDVLEVAGVFHRVDPDTAEAAVIRAEAGEVVRRGGPVDDDRLVAREAAAAILGAIALALVAWERLAALRRRRGG